MNENKSSLAEITRDINIKAKSLYKFVVLYSDMMIRTHDYGTEEIISMVEMHLLTIVEENPGITVGGLAKEWGRSVGAISQQLKKLESKGHIIKKKYDDNAKSIHLFATDKGIKLSLAHKKYDAIDIMDTTKILLQNCSIEEIDSFYKVIDEYNKILENDSI